MGKTGDRLDRVLDLLENVRPEGSGYSARCPAHDDRVSSLSVAAGDRAAVVMHCHAGCPVEKILVALKMTIADLSGEPFIEAEYVYQRLDGTELWTVERWANPKDFRVRPGLPNPADRVLYNLPWIDYARRTGQVVYVVEGEKDVETLRAHVLIGTCNVGGAGRGKWLPHYSESLAGCDVIVVADRDEPGLRHARTVYRSVREKARSAVLAQPTWGKDVSELLAAGYPIDHIEPVPEEAPLTSIRASSVPRSRVRWAWNRYFPMGTMSIIEGDPGDGKSTLTCDLVARWSTGMPMPDGSSHGGPWHTMMVSIEDDPAATIVPRLESAGADLDRVILVTGGQSPELPYNIGVDLDATERQVQQQDIKIIVLDPLMAFMPDKTNGLVDAEVRRALGPLQQMARRLDVAVIVVRHLTKSATRALYAGSGSIGIVGAARAAFLVRPDPRDAELRVMAPSKTNLVRRPAALGYRMEHDDARDVARVRWTGAVIDLDADSLFEGRGNGDELRERDRAADWLERLLDNCYLKWDDILTAGRTDGFSARTLQRAREGIADYRINPAVGGTLLLGSYWYRNGQDPFTDGDPLPRVALVASGQALAMPVAKVKTLATSATESDEADEALDAAELACDQCGSATALKFGTPWYAVRCRAHNPLTWSA